MKTSSGFSFRASLRNQNLNFKIKIMTKLECIILHIKEANQLQMLVCPWGKATTFTEGGKLVAEVFSPQFLEEAINEAAYAGFLLDRDKDFDSQWKNDDGAKESQL